MDPSDVTLKEFYDKLYKVNPVVFGDTSSHLLERVLSVLDLQLGNALDLGAGAGLSSLNLASRGFRVTAVDLSSHAFSAIGADSQGLIDQVHQGVLDFPLKGEYAIVCSFLLFHHLDDTKVLELIGQIQQHTLIGGVNVFKFFTQESAFYTESPGAKNFFAVKGEMLTLYSGWNILVDEESQSNAAVGGSTNTVQSFAAQRLS